MKILLAVFFIGTSVVAAENEALSNEQTRVAAENAVLEQRFGLARKIAKGLLQSDPKDYRALISAAAAGIGLGEFTDAAGYAQRAFSSAKSDLQRVNAARLAASANFRAGRYTLAEFWLRRGRNNVGDQATEAALRRDFVKARARNPLSAKLSFSIAPNNNINNGSSSDSMIIFGLPFILNPDARPLSGIEVSAGLDLRYRLSESTEHQTEIGAMAFGRTYRMSDVSKAATPDVNGSDFAFSVTELSLNQSRRFPGIPGPTRISVLAGKNWYGGAPYTRYARLSAGQDFIAGPGDVWLISGSYEWRSIFPDEVKAGVATMGTGYMHRLRNGDQVKLTAQVRDTQSSDDATEYRSLSGAIQYAFAEPVLQAKLSLSLSSEKRNYLFSIYDAAGRQDRTVTVSATALFTDVSYFGYSPTLSLEASRTNSNISLYDRESLRLRAGIQSTF